MPNNCLPIVDLAINSKSGGETPNSKRIIGITYLGNEPSSFSWGISGQGTSIVSGANTLTPEFQFGNSTGTITFDGFDCENNVISATYNFTLNNLVTPIVSKINETTLRWTNDATNTSNTKTIEVYNNSGLVSSTVNTSGSNDINIGIGNYKIRYSFNGTDYSAFSNIITSNPTTTITPTISINPTNGIVDIGNNVVFTINNYITGSLIRVYKNSIYLNQFSSNTFTTNNTGDYTFTMEETGSIESTKTSIYIVSNTPSSTLCNTSGTFSVSNLVYNYLNNNFTFSFAATDLTSAIWKIKLGSNVIDSGTIPSFSSNSKTIVTNVNLSNNTYTFELTGTSCTGVATGNFTVSGVQIGCVFSNLLTEQNVNDSSLINVRVDSSTNITSLVYDLLDTNNVVISANQPVINFSLLSGNTYQCQLDFIDVFEGSYKIKIKNDSNTTVCSIINNFNFIITSTDITTDILTGNCDFANLSLSQSLNSNNIIGSFNSAILINTLLFDILDTDLQPLFQDNIVEIVSSGSGTYNIKLNLGSLVSGNYIFKIKTSTCNINSSSINFVRVVEEVNKSTTPVISFNYETSEFSFLPDCNNGDVKVYVNDVLFYEPITKTISGTIYKSLLELSNNDQLKVTVTCPLKLVSDFSNVLFISSNTCVPVNKNDSTVITGLNTVNQGSSNTYSINMSNFGGTLPFIIETTVVGGVISSGNNTSSINVLAGAGQQMIIKFKVINCSNKFVEVTKTIDITISIITPDTIKIISLIGNSLKGICLPNTLLNIYNENNQLIVKNVLSDSSGVFTTVIKKYNAYYAKNTSGQMSNVFTLVSSCKKCITGIVNIRKCNNCKI